MSGRKIRPLPAIGFAVTAALPDIPKVRGCNAGGMPSSAIAMVARLAVETSVTMVRVNAVGVAVENVRVIMGDTETTPYAQFEGIADYDPYGTHQLVTGTLLSGYTHRSAEQTIGKLLDECSTNGSYGSSHFSTQGVGGFVLTPAQHFSSANNDPGGRKVSRQGCHSGAPLWAALARSINLPTKEYHGILTGFGHHSMEFLSIRLPPKDTSFTGDGAPFYLVGYDNTPKGAIMTHGDWPYDSRWQAVPGTNKLIARGYHEDNVFGRSAGTIDLAQVRASFHVYFDYLTTAYWLPLYQSLGWTSFKETYLDPYLLAPGSEPWTTRIHRDLAARNGEGQI